jgi:hypothetical protein
MLLLDDRTSYKVFATTGELSSLCSVSYYLPAKVGFVVCPVQAHDKYEAHGILRDENGSEMKTA